MQRADFDIIDLGTKAYTDTWQEMKAFTDARTEQTADQIWLVQHPPVFTQGQAGKSEHVLHAGDIPIVQTDRGGQVTYHGLGQLVFYPLLNLRRLGLGVRQLVTLLEQTTIDLMGRYGITAEAKPDAPGVYVDGQKIASLGLRVRKGCSYHGLSINVDMDLEPFLRIHPCGYNGLKMTQLIDRVQIDPRQAAEDNVNIRSVQTRLLDCFFANLFKQSKQ